MNKKLLVVTLIVTAMFCWLNAEQKVINLSYSAGDYEFITTTEGTQIKYNGSQNVVFSNEPGAPNLPTQLVMVAIPDGAEFQNLSFSYNAEIVLSNVEIAPAQNIMPTSMQVGDAEIVDPDPQYYAVGEYPENSCIYSSTQILRTYRVFCFQVSPFIYLPLTNQLKLITTGSLIINYGLTDFRNDAMWDDGSAGETLKRIVINPNDVIVQNNRDIVNPNDVKYLIITDYSLVDEFTPLADWKTQKGIPADIITTQYINSHYPGAELALKIKNCIKDYYLTKGTTYVLLGGDPTIIPAALCYGIVDNYGTNNDYSSDVIPTDLFYSCLDGQINWNYDGDNYVGEIEDGINGNDIDLLPEIFIGRIAVTTLQNAIASQFVEKTLGYEKYENYPVSGNYAKKLLFAGKWIMPPNPSMYGGLSDSDYYSRLLYNEVISPWGNPLYLFDTSQCYYNGLNLTFNHNSLITLINSGLNILNWSSHGTNQAWDGAASEGYAMCPAYLSSLTNDNCEGIVYTTSCHTNNFNHPDGEDCLGELLVGAQNKGAVSYIGASHYNWYSYNNPIASDFATEFYNLYSIRIVPIIL